MSYDTTTTAHLEAGSIAIGDVIYTRTTDSDAKSIATPGNWIEGSVPYMTTTQEIYLYAYNNSGTSWDLKFASADPVYSDTDSNTAGMLRYYNTGSVDYRAMGWAYVSNDALATNRWGNVVSPYARNTTYVEDGAYATHSATTPADDTVPAKTETDQYMVSGIVPTSKLSKLRVTATANFGSSGGGDVFMGLFRDSEAVPQASTFSTIGANEEEQMSINYEVVADTTDWTEFRLHAGNSSNGLYFNGRAAARLYGGTAKSTITIEEIP